MKYINQIGNAINYKKWAEVKDAADQLKKFTGHIGASHMHYDCHFMQDAYSQKRPDLMVKRYNRLIEDTIVL